MVLRVFIKEINCIGIGNRIYRKAVGFESHRTIYIVLNQPGARFSKMYCAELRAVLTFFG